MITIIRVVFARERTNCWSHEYAKTQNPDRMRCSMSRGEDENGERSYTKVEKKEDGRLRVYISRVSLSRGIDKLLLAT